MYFNTALLDAALNSSQAPFLNKDLLSGYRNFGGVRIEDTIAITDTGFQILSNAPKELQEIVALWGK